jgi:UDPglucose 6-dehydrogenase
MGLVMAGSCFPKDVCAHTFNRCSYDFKILNSVMEVNHNQEDKINRPFEGYFKNDLAGKQSLYGALAFKTNHIQMIY